MNDTFKRFIPISKVDDDQRMVYGWASTPSLDSDGEVVSLDAIKNALPEYLQFPTIREMHQAKAAGTTKTAEIVNNKDNQGLYIGAKIVADDAWKMVKEGVYKGFSIGGHILEKVENTIKSLDLVEISLVDVPANKDAKIEAFKILKTKIEKDANGITVLTNLMNDAMYVRDFLSSRKKNTKAMDKMIEQIKSQIADEAGEAEQESPAGGGYGVMYAETITDIDKRIKSLNEMEFGDNKVADALRKGVIIAMQNKKSDIAKKDEEVKDTEVKAEVNADEAKTEETKEPKTPESVETETKSEEKKEEKTEEKSEEESTEENKEEESAKDENKVEDQKSEEKEETENPEEKKESSETPTTLAKLNEIDKKLEKIVPTKEVEKLDTAKTVQAMASTMAKFVSVIEEFDARLKKVESTPAALKSKAVFVHKSSAEEETQEDNSKSTVSSELTAKKARLAELNKKYDELGPYQFAQKGFSLEAAKLDREISSLELKSKSK